MPLFGPALDSLRAHLGSEPKEPDRWVTWLTIVALVLVGFLWIGIGVASWLIWMEFSP